MHRGSTSPRLRAGFLIENGLFIRLSLNDILYSVILINFKIVQKFKILIFNYLDSTVFRTFHFLGIQQ